MGTGEIDGLVEADECYLRYSYKGNHSKSKRFTMPRPARKRGGESVGKRGLSSEQVCIGTALDRTGNILIGMIGTGRAKYDDLKRSLRVISLLILFCVRIALMAIVN